MAIEHIPLLQIQRDLHDIPRGFGRFTTYLETMVNDTGDDIDLVPLVSMNPMGREHINERLDHLLAIDAESTAANALVEGIARLGDMGIPFRHGLVIMDDLHGGWSNPILVDAGFRFGFDLPVKRLWMVTPLFASREPTEEMVRQAVLMTVFRFRYVQQHGRTITLADILRQEGQAAVFAGLVPYCDADEINYTRQIIAPLRDSTDFSVQIAALYGGEVARSLGYAPQGVSAKVAFDVALVDALAEHQPLSESSD